jgi:hypothetical protein
MLLWAGCSNMVAPSNQNETGLRITISGGTAGSRTLYPHAVFSKYILTFDGPEPRQDITLPAGQSSVAVGLAAGQWIVTATGYVMIKETEYAAAEGSEQVTITAGSFQEIGITIQASQDGEDGFFSYSVNFPQSKVNEAELRIYPFGGNYQYAQLIDLRETSSDLLPLRPGYYMMSIRLYNDYDYQTATRTEVVHIYSNMETSAEYTFAEEDFTNTIDFDAANAVPLTDGVWTDGNITTSNAVDWYSINVSAGTHYYFWWDDSYSGDGTGTLDIYVYAFSDSAEIIFLEDDIGFEPMSFIVDYSGTVYIRVCPLDGDSTGAYAIRYSTSATYQHNPVPLTANIWADGNIRRSNAENWFSMDVTAWTTYYIWLNDRYSGDGSKTLNVIGWFYNSDGVGIGGVESQYGYDGLFTYGQFTAGSDGTVYIGVRALNYLYPTGTYGIMYSTTLRSGVNLWVSTLSSLELTYNPLVVKGNNLYVRVYLGNFSHTPDLTYAWFIDSVPQDVSTETSAVNAYTGTTYLPTSGLSAGKHYGLVVVTIDGTALASKFAFQVNE